MSPADSSPTTLLPPSASARSQTHFDSRSSPLSSFAVDVADESLKQEKGYRVDHVVTGREMQLERDELYEMRPHHVGYGPARVRATGEEVLGRTKTGKDVFGSLPPISGASPKAFKTQSEMSAFSVASNGSQLSKASQRSRASVRSNMSKTSSITHLQELERKVLARRHTQPAPHHSTPQPACTRVPCLAQIAEEKLKTIALSDQLRMQSINEH